MEIIPPILHREFLVRSRRRSTYMVRPLTAVVSILIVAVFQGLPMLFGSGTVRVGTPVFQLCAYFLWMYCLVEGLRNSSDCLSSEKREGTIGLLFLTRMRGRQVVMGKLSSGMISSSFNLVAALPVLGMLILLGGVTFDEYLRICVALVSSLGVALAIGGFVSAQSRFAGRSLVTSLAVVLIWNLASVIASKAMGSFFPSPWSLFSGSFDGLFQFDSSTFWISLLVLWSVVFVLGLLSGVVLEKRWQIEGGGAAESARNAKDGKHRWLLPPRVRQVGEKHPLESLLNRRSSLRYGKRFAILVLFLGVVAAALAPLRIGVEAICTWLLFGLAIWEGSRIFVGNEGRACLELLLTTPIRLRDVFHELGQYSRRFAFYAVMLVFVLKLVAFVGEAALAINSDSTAPLLSGLTKQLSSQWNWSQVSKVFGLKLIELCIDGVAGYCWFYGAFWYALWRGARSATLTSALGWILIVTVVAFVLYLWIGMAMLMAGVFGMGRQVASSPHLVELFISIMIAALMSAYFLVLAKHSRQKLWMFLCPAPPMSHVHASSRIVSLR